MSGNAVLLEFRCEFCPCVFASQVDLDSHLKTFGSVPHLRLWERIHSEVLRVRVGWCTRGGKRRMIFDAVDSRILCCGCRHFEGSFPVVSL